MGKWDDGVESAAKFIEEHGWNDSAFMVNQKRCSENYAHALRSCLKGKGPKDEFHKPKNVVENIWAELRYCMDSTEWKIVGRPYRALVEAVECFDPTHPRQSEILHSILAILKGDKTREVPRG